MPDRLAFDRLVNATYRRLLWLARRHTPTPEDAEDLVARVLLRAWQRFDRYDPSKATFFTWCRRLLLHQVYDDNRYPRPSSVPLPEREPEDSGTETPDAGVAVQAFLAALDPCERQIALQVMAGESLHHIAQAMGLPEEWVYGLAREWQVVWEETAGA